jgi:polyhydroxybutyrate depolymerase
MHVVILLVVAACKSPGPGTTGVHDGSVTGGADARLAVDDAGGCVAPSPSTDCGAALAPGDQRTCTISIGGTMRTYLLYAPATYDPCHPAALVVDAHGAQESAEVHAGLANFYNWPTLGIGSSFRLVADREGFVVATPQGIGNAWVQADTAFVTAIPAAVGAHTAIDSSRVYLSGISNGGGLTYWTACADAGVFHGFAPISGYDDNACPVSHPAPLIHFHTQTDKLVSYAAGQTAFEQWRQGNHCQAQPVSELRFGGANGDSRPVCLSHGTAWSLVACDPAAPQTVCERYTGCDSGDVVFCTVPPDNEYDGGTTGGHILYFNGTKLSLAAVTWDILAE